MLGGGGGGDVYARAVVTAGGPLSERSQLAQATNVGRVMQVGVQICVQILDRLRAN